MKIIERKSAAKNEDFITSVARSIGSTLGTVAAKVNGRSPASRRRPAARTRARKHVSVSHNRRRASASVSKRNNKVARLTRKKRRNAAK